MHVVLNTKYRPTKFDDICGQKHITLTVQNAIKEDRLANCYIFSGPRGTGKTTTARIFAKTINCPGRKGTTPCLACESCRFIQSGSDQDVIELDAASNRNVEDIRILREHAVYVPLRGKYKIFIIDEAHMLTREAFNTLLKLLEEPPSHAKFILATTELNKVPDTIASRAQIFEFKRLSNKEIYEYLRNICDKEGFKVDGAIINKISSLSSGSLRDSISLLEQLVTYNPSPSIDDFNNLLGLVKEDEILRLLNLIADQDKEAIIAKINDLYQRGVDMSIFTAEALDVMNRMLAYKICKDKFQDARDDLKTTTDKFTLEHILYCIQLALNMRRFLREDVEPVVLLNSYFIKMSMFDDAVDIMKELKSPKTTAKTPEVRQTPAQPYQKPSQPATASGIAKHPPSTGDLASKWQAFLPVIQQKTNPLVKTLLQMCRPAKIENNCLIAIAPSNMKKKLYEEQVSRLNRGEYKKQVEEALSEVFTDKLSLKIEFSSESAEPAAMQTTQPAAMDSRLAGLMSKFPGSKIETVSDVNNPSTQLSKDRRFPAQDYSALRPSPGSFSQPASRQKEPGFAPPKSKTS